MHLTITDKAIHQLNQLKLEENKILRIDAEMQGGCGTMMKFKLIEDDTRKGDIVLHADGMNFHVDLFTKRNLDDELTLDYDKETGFLFESEWGPMGLECHLA
ncbi:iron-sulfur cluster biosynthesis family protein [Pseudalkalibacillus berkeleyi]|uniref:Iron-sulfur cluster biosynthesis family protein n=1 Tax=Pseudalkalibacillus berkeleyi TaxID=1069813 RepID=A0ABS9GYM2_9BACL|nr:iron-sulfur cluster biosynthesis family protein [Pseudalkalibacillus berkeleyi]MCF6136700.1 iron-sulfur cluster biosynthesis family protein [Pseudalkalibacillus berkeleyi]